MKVTKEDSFSSLTISMMLCSNYPDPEQGVIWEGSI
jgi:hypothetical protein